jgi:CheY-like chemotaxis protein
MHHDSPPHLGTFCKEKLLEYFHQDGDSGGDGFLNTCTSLCEGYQPLQGSFTKVLLLKLGLKEAVERTNEGHPDLIVMDIHMPTMN